MPRFLRRPRARIARLALALPLAASTLSMPPLGAQPQEKTIPATGISGLRERVTVRRDVRGIPYIEARSAHDLYLAQGYVTAGDRLWQMDLLRRSARGELAEIFGKDALEQDVQVRTFGFGGIADGLVTRVSPALREALEAYAEGVNANIAARGEKGLPVEFGILGYRPAPWRPSDSLVIGKLFALDLDSSWPTELMQASFADLPEPRRRELFIEESPLDVLLVGARGGKENRLAPAAGALNDKAPVTWLTPDAPAARFAGGAPGILAGAAPGRLAGSARARLALLKEALRYTRSRAFGLAASNSWVVSGKKSATGKPLLANDPHLSATAPSFWYMSHLAAPGLRVAGVTAPGVVGILLGHNERIAWGVTNLMADVQDLYAERFDASGMYATPAGPRAPTLRHERITVGPASPDAAPTVSEQDVVVTRHGPIVFQAGDVRYALRWTALDPDACEVCAFFDVDRAGDWKEFQAALARFSGPSLNIVYADASGHIGWSAAGRIPLRADGDGTVPADGATDRGDWSGFVPWGEMPRLLDPPNGLIVTANNRVVGAAYPHAITHAWGSPHRASRIRELLAGGPHPGAKDARQGASGAPVSVEDCATIQADTVSIADRTFIAAVLEVGRQRHEAHEPRVPPGDTGAEAAWTAILDTFKDWDGRASESSRIMPLAAAMRTLFAVKVLEGALGPERAAAYSWPNRDTLLDQIAMQRPSSWLPKEYPSWADLFLDCWREARVALAKKAGEDPAAWTWGKLADPVIFAHPLAGMPDAGARFAIDPIPASTGGSGETVNAGGAVSMRFIADTADWDRSRMGIALGESGDPASPHWKDQLDAWRTVRTPILPFSKGAVARAGVEVQVLVPQEKSAK